jgi:uncharacterized protein YdhG (YjbR/CyaY superfamily)
MDQGIARACLLWTIAVPHGISATGAENLPRISKGDTMKSRQAAPKDMDEYIAGFPADVQSILERIRKTIRKAAPGAQETISYQIPTFTLNGKYLVYFAAYKKHIGVYPAPVGNAEFKEDLSPYAAGKGTARFPLDKPIPFALIGRIVRFRLEETGANTAKEM